MGKKLLWIAVMLNSIKNKRLYYPKINIFWGGDYLHTHVISAALRSLCPARTKPHPGTQKNSKNHQERAAMHGTYDG